MNSFKFSVLLAVLAGIIVLFSMTSEGISLLVSKLINICLVLLFGSLFSLFWNRRDFNQDEKIAKNSTAVATFLGLVFVAVAIVINSPF